MKKPENKTRFSMPNSDKLILSDLAAQVAEIAARPEEQAKAKLWCDHNQLLSTRPLVFCDPENGWGEIITPEILLCESPIARSWEKHFRREIFWAMQMCDDKVIEPYFNVSHVCTDSGWGLSGDLIGGGGGNAYTWEPPVKDFSDLGKLRFPEITVDYEATEEIVNLAQEVVGEHLTVRMKSAWWWSLGMTWTLINLRGLEQMMWDMIDNPKMVHSLMAFLRDGTLAKLDFLEANGLLSLNNRGDYVGSGGFGWTDNLPQNGFDGQVRTMDMWGFGESQETVGVSPDMFEEFVFQYQAPILERFGLNCYGCCEPVDTRWDVVKKTPRLRRVSVSPWNDQKQMAENLQDKYIFSSKPNPSLLAMPTFDEDLVRNNIREIVEAAKGCHLELIMKDNNTIGNDSNRVVRWVQIVREEIDRI